MTTLQAIIIGIVQGLTEFLPISSTAHLRIVPALLGWGDPGAAFSAVIQCGTLAAVLAYFWRDVQRIARAWAGELVRGELGDSLDARMGWMMIVATMPVVIFGLLLKKYIENEFRSLYVISAALIGLALLLVVAEWLLARRIAAKHVPRNLEQVRWWDAILIGLAQAASLVPGSSRSGVTITAGLFAGLSREAAARFSFLLSLPAVLAAGVYELYKERDVLIGSQADAANLLAATVASAIVGYLSIAFLLRFLRTHTTYVFIVYRVVLGLALLGLIASGRLEPTEQPNPAPAAVAEPLP